MHVETIEIALDRIVGSIDTTTTTTTITNLIYLIFYSSLNFSQFRNIK